MTKFRWVMAAFVITLVVGSVAEAIEKARNIRTDSVGVVQE